MQISSLCLTVVYYIWAHFFLSNKITDTPKCYSTKIIILIPGYKEQSVLIESLNIIVKISQNFEVKCEKKLKAENINVRALHAHYLCNTFVPIVAVSRVYCDSNLVHIIIACISLFVHFPYTICCKRKYWVGV